MNCLQLNIMNSEPEYETYGAYKKRVISLLVKNRTWMEDGVYKYKGVDIAKEYILPLDNGQNNAINRALAIEKYLHFDCKKCLGDRLIGLHQYAHHLTSSQQLCMKFFSELIDVGRCATEEMVAFMKNAFGISIHAGAKCDFEYSDESRPYQFDADKNGVIREGPGFYEGTSFDFHIEDGDTEVFFEIKFTEQGFKKEKDDERHIAKAQRYLDIESVPRFLRDIVKTPAEFLEQYQIYRNVIRATNNNKYVVFITDGNNPATMKDVEFIKKFRHPQNVIFKTWQEIIDDYPFELPFQLKAIQDYE